MKSIKLTLLPLITLIVALFTPMQAAQASNCFVSPTPILIQEGPDDILNAIEGTYVDFINCRINEAGITPQVTRRTKRKCVQIPQTPNAQLEPEGPYCLTTRMDILYDTGTGLTYFNCTTLTQGPSANTGSQCFDPDQPKKAPAYGAGVNASVGFGFIAAENNKFCVESAAVFPGTSIKDNFCLLWNPSF